MYSETCQTMLSQEFGRMKDMCYLDHAGATLYAESQIKSSARDLCENVYGNPHSLSLCSRLSTDVIDQIRFRVLQHFHTNPDEYSVIFTSGATAALKIVAETFMFSSSKQNAATAGNFVYMQDNHTSVLGMREVVVRNGANIQCLSHEEAFKLLSNESTDSELQTVDLILKGNSLFAYPAQCNFSGVKYPLEWIHKVQSGMLERNGFSKHGSRWFCLLDAAAFVSTNPLHLSKFKPDFICLSFYKIFGYPTGLGALLVKNSSASVLEKCYFGGGTVQISLSCQRFHVHRESISERFEDGTLPFLSIIAVRHGFETVERLAGTMSDIAKHTFSLAQYLFHFLKSVHHANGAPAAVLYCDTDYSSAHTQGNIVNFNLLRPNGEFVGFVEVLNMANLHGIQLRTGCFCNPGACQRHLCLSDEQLKHHFQAGHVCGDERDLINGQPTGSVRVSFGYMTTRSDADKLIHMLTECFVQGTPVFKLPEWWSSFQQEYRIKFNIASNSAEETNQTKTCTVTDNGRHLQHDENEEFEDCSSECLLQSEGVGSLMHMFVYPVKSCAAVSVEDWLIGPRGFLYDREWMIVTPAGVSLTQKQEIKLCLIRPGLDLNKGLLTLDFPEMQQIAVPLATPDEHSQKMSVSLCQSKVCGDRVQGWDCGRQVARWLSEALGWHGLRLIRQWDTDTRVIKKHKHTSLGEAKAELSLSNQAQFLLLNNASIQWLASKIQDDSACNKDGLMKRFRSNLVVQGASAFEENDWTHVEIGDAHFECEGPCTRCQMVCIDQDTAERTREPLHTIAAEFHGKMRFGIYLSHKSKTGRITVGDKFVSL